MRIPVICITVLLAACTVIRAQENEETLFGFGISPTLIALDARPGRSQEETFYIVTQNLKRPGRFVIEVTDLDQSKSGNIFSAERGKGVRSCASWIEVANEVVVQPNRREEVPFRVSFPSNIRGAYFAYITIRHVPEGSKEATRVMVQPSISIRVEAVAPGRGTMNIDVSDLKLEPAGTGGDYRISFTASNTGVWKTTVEGDILLYGPRGVFPIRTQVPYETSGKPVSIYPGRSARISCPLHQMLPSGRYKIQARLMLNGKYPSVNHLGLEIPESITGGGVAANLLGKSEYDIDVMVEPSLIELNLTSGASRTVPIRVRNNDNRIATVTAKVKAVQMEPSGMLTFPEEQDLEMNLVSVSPESLVVEPRRTAVLKLNVQVPRDTSIAGSLVRAIHLMVTGPETGGDWQSGAEFGVLLISSDAEAPQAILELDEPDLIRVASRNNPSTAAIRLRNKGGRAARFHGTVKLERTGGQTIATMDIGRGREEIILPGGEREFRMPIPPIDEGNFKVRAEFATVGAKSAIIYREVSFKSTGVFSAAGTE